MMPCTWCSGSASSRRSDGRPSPRLDERRDLRADVLMRGDRALRPAGRAAGVDDHRAAVRAEVRQIVGRRRRRAPSLVVTKRARAARASGVSMAADAGSPTTTDAPESRITYSSSAGGCDTASGTATPPARQMPRCTAAYAKPGGTRNATRVWFRSALSAEQRSGHAARRVVELRRR